MVVMSREAQWLERSSLKLKVLGARRPVGWDFSKTHEFAQQEMGTRPSLDMEKVKAVRRSGGTPPQLHRCRY